jgi:hypothetical protein
VERIIATRKEKRVKWLSEGSSNPDTEEGGIKEFLKHWKADGAETGSHSSMTPAEYIALKPLQDCVYDIAWDVAIQHSPQCALFTPFLGRIGETWNLELLRSASLYQASHENVSGR